MKKILFVILLGLISCETEITNYKAKNLNNSFVIYGEITNLPGPHAFRINYLIDYDPYDITKYIGKPVDGAEVEVIDKDGKTVALEAFGQGLYKTPMGFKGVVNQFYQLSVKTVEGYSIQSDFQELLPPPELKGFDYTFVNAEKVEDMYFDVKASIIDKKGTKDFYFVKKQDFIEFITTCPEPPPPPASPPACYSKCWQAPLNTQPELLSDFLVDGQELPLTFPRINAFDFTKWVVQVEAYNVSKEISEYWKRQEEQRTIGGGLFDKIPAQIGGNLSCTNEPNIEVLGIFVVAGKTKKRLEIDRFKSFDQATLAKVQTYLNFNDLRNKELKVYNCDQAGWVDYNIGFSLPPE
ncbi:protein of unknown function [Spirosomataceae bacterium TFI 002]|nr:protein of unknown function [Spirosomataceae bacterium TFI 002]